MSERHPDLLTRDEAAALSSANWKRVTTAAGYRVVHAPSHPKAWRGTGYVHVHRLVAEAKLGRPLRGDEVVHHIDGNKHNNSPENLEVLSNSEHARHHASTGVTMVALVCSGCGKAFERRKGRDPAAKKSKTAYCSRACYRGRSRR